LRNSFTRKNSHIQRYIELRNIAINTDINTDTNVNASLLQLQAYRHVTMKHITPHITLAFLAIMTALAHAFPAPQTNLPATRDAPDLKGTETQHVSKDFSEQAGMMLTQILEDGFDGPVVFLPAGTGIEETDGGTE
jgi:hypothetical protein